MKRCLFNAMFGVGFTFLMTDLLLFPISQTVFVHSLKKMALHVLQNCEMVCLPLLDLVLGKYRLKAKLHKCTRFVPCNSSVSCAAPTNEEPGVDSGINTVPLHTVHCAKTVPAASEASKGAQIPAPFLEVPSAVLREINLNSSQDYKSYKARS